MSMSCSRAVMALAIAGSAAIVLSPARGDQKNEAPKPPQAPPAAAAKKPPEFPPFEKVSADLEKVVSTADGKAPLWTLYANKKDGRLLAELPRAFEKQLVLIAPTVASGDEEAGVMGSTLYAKWKRFDKRLALIEPNFLVRGAGDPQAKKSVEDLFTDRVILDVPIAAMGPGGGPVVDLKALLLGQQAEFFNPFFGGYGPTVKKVRSHLAELTTAKAFPENVEITYDVPAADGRLVSLHYSVRVLPEKTGFKPRLADNRVGYFNVYYNELGPPTVDDTYKRYIARWHVEKADPKLSMSPPKQPIVWYIEHTTPIRYRRFVREGILEWNKAFEGIGIVNAVEVYQQDAGTGAHMEKDPEDARYNFFRWNTSTQGYAIGPSRWDPRTGQILDADVVWHAGLTRAVASMLRGLSAEVAIQGFTPETLTWLDRNPQWDPRIRLAPAAVREQRLAEHRRRKIETAEATAIESLGDSGASHILGHEHDAITQFGAACRIGDLLAMNIGLFAAGLEAGTLGLDDDDDSHDEDGTGDATLDDLPEAFLGGMIKYIAAHEVGHTMGLQHNFGASTIRSLEHINSETMTGQPIVGSVMEYAGVNINKDDGDIQGAYATPTIGPYDYWAIAFGYGAEDQRGDVLARVAEPDLVFLNDIATIGPDPRAQVWDMGADSLNFAESRMRLIRELRTKIISDIVKDGDSWRKARTRYEGLLNNHMLSLVVATRWVGGSYVHFDHKGDPGDRDPIENVASDKQRRALKFILDNVVKDDAFGLSPELIHKLGVQFWPDAPGYESIFDDPSYEVHDLVGGVQAAALTMLMNPTKLRRVYDNEFRTAGDEEAITLAEMMSTIHKSVWTELWTAKGPKYTAANPMISSFRRNLQREHLERLIALSMPDDAASPAMRTVATLSALKLRQLRKQIHNVPGPDERLDDYSLAHLTDAKDRIDRALDAIYVYK